jgi:iron complex transport system substrate-binding protein
LAAVVSGNIALLDDDIASRWGPRIVELVAAIGEAITKASAK